VRRELWENRFVYIAPIVVTAFVLFGSLITMIVARKPSSVLAAFRTAPAPIMLTTFLVGMIYCLDALYGERRDRSILFWKSLPVSDRTTVLSKVMIPLVALPVIGYALSVATQVILIVLSSPFLLAKGLWGGFDFFEGLIVMAYGLGVHALWFAPIYGWLTLISAWTKRAPFLWALLPVLVVSAVEKIVFSTTYFMQFLQYRVTGAMKEAFTFISGRQGHVDTISQLEPGRFLSAGGLWAGLIAAAAFYAAAVRLRRNREPI
jgi:ABC-2 type transport system permease protein